MTAAEKRIYLDWNRKMSKKSDERDLQFKLMQQLYVEKLGAKASCSLDYNLDCLITSCDESTRSRALNIYRRYHKADAQYMAMCELAQALANL